MKFMMLVFCMPRLSCYYTISILCPVLLYLNPHPAGLVSLHRDGGGGGPLIAETHYNIFWCFSWSRSCLYFFYVSGQYCPNYRLVLEEQVKRFERHGYFAATADIFGIAQHLAFIGEAGNTAGNNEKFSLVFFIRCASPIGGVQIAGPIVLAQHKGNRRIGEAQTPIRCALPIVTEITY